MGNIECAVEIIMEKGQPVQIVMRDCSWTTREEKIVLTLPLTIVAIKENDQNPKDE